MSSNLPNQTNQTVIRAVIDTSTLAKHQLRKEIQQAAEQQDFVAIWSVWIVAELNRILTWRWIKHPPARLGIAPNDLSGANEKKCSNSAKEMMGKLIPVFETVDPHPPYPDAWDTLTDEGDLPIFAAAKKANAQYVVSENTSDYPPKQPDGRYVHEGIEYISGRAFLDLLDAQRKGLS